MEKIYTIPINEKFEASAADPACGCPFCALFRMLENNELERILGASMMEPDIRIQTNEEGFCKTHYDLMFARGNRLGMALTMESHLHELQKDLAPSLLAPAGRKALSRIGKLEESCFVCRITEYHFSRMLQNALEMWDREEEFREKLAAQPYFCLPHYRRFLALGEAKLSKARAKEFVAALDAVVRPYLDKLADDVSWFCKKFDYRYENEPWKDSKDAVERTMKFLRSDIHVNEKKKTTGG